MSAEFFALLFAKPVRAVTVVGLLLCGAFAGQAFAQLSPSEIVEERAAIASERQQAKSKLDARLEACRHVFQTTRCVDEANADWRHVRLQTNERTAVVDQIERKRRAAERLEEIEKNQVIKKQRDSDIETEMRGRAADEAADADKDKRREEAANAAASAASKAAQASADRREQAAARCVNGQRKEAGHCVASSKPQEQAAQFDKRAAEAADHKAAVIKRNASRDAAKAGKPLPVPLSIPAAAGAASRAP